MPLTPNMREAEEDKKTTTPIPTLLLFTTPRLTSPPLLILAPPLLNQLRMVRRIPIMMLVDVSIAATRRSVHGTFALLEA